MTTLIARRPFITFWTTDATIENELCFKKVETRGRKRKIPEKVDKDPKENIYLKARYKMVRRGRRVHCDNVEKKKEEKAASTQIAEKKASATLKKLPSEIRSQPLFSQPSPLMNMEEEIRRFVKSLPSNSQLPRDWPEKMVSSSEVNAVPSPKVEPTGLYPEVNSSQDSVECFNLNCCKPPPYISSKKVVSTCGATGLDVPIEE